MRIMYLLFSFTVGGTERLVANICNEMSTRGHEVHLYVVNDLVSNEMLKYLDKEIRVKLQKRSVGSGDKLKTLFEVARYIRNNRIDIVHSNSFNSPELLVVSKLLNPRCRIIHTIHGVRQFENVKKTKIILLNCLCDILIGVSNSVKSDMLIAGLDPRKIVCVYNGCKFPIQESDKKHSFDSKHLVIGCVARIEPKIKGQDVLIKSIPYIINEYPNVKVLFAGGVAKSEELNYKSLLSYVNNHNLSNNIAFIGTVEDVPYFLKNIDICVVPSRSEGFGLSLIEAMAEGVPCIASDIDGPKELITKEDCGVLFEVDNEKDLADKINFVIKNYDEIFLAAQKKSNQIRDNYSIENMCNRLIDIYND